ncbi:MAG: hypothetical protein CMA12_00420 [Euryarchaeota archaeon]|nr:hypothetical protein [Euryarchaeota archaeon]|tara:strand:- start:2579 stop:5329 length:2751 start_codon:yes stop_codon:yes gene_type:complete
MKPFLKYRKNVYSQNGEDGILLEICDRIGLKDLEVCEFGAWDGKHFSNTFNLVKNHNAKAVYIESDKIKFLDLLKTANKYQNITPIQSEINLHDNLFDNVVSKTFLKRDFDILSIDIDSNDLEIWESIKSYQPKIVIIEICSYISPGKLERYNLIKNTKNSFSSTIKVGKSKEYTPIVHVGNLIFIKNEFLTKINIEEEFIYNDEKIFLNDWKKKFLIDNLKKKLFRITPDFLLEFYKQKRTSNYKDVIINNKSKISKKIFILQHFGLGDFLSCKGLIKYLVENKKFDTSDINLFVPEKHFINIEFLYRDFNLIKLVKVKNERDAIRKFNNQKKIKSDAMLIKIGHSNFYKTIKSNFENKQFTTDMVFYKQFKIPYNYRFKYGQWSRNIQEENRVFDKLNPNRKKYIFIHDDPSRDLIIDVDDLNLKNKDIMIIKNDTSEKLFNLGLILERAEQIHVMESSIRHLIECLDIDENKLFLHSFRKNLSKGPYYNFNSGKIIGSQKNWNIISKNLNQNKKNYTLNSMIFSFKKIINSLMAYNKIKSNDNSFLKKLKFFIIFYIIKKNAIIRILTKTIDRFQITNEIGIYLLKKDFHFELDKCNFFTTRSLISSVGNFTYKKEYPNEKKQTVNILDQLVFFVKSSEIIKFEQEKLNKINKEFILISGDSDVEINIKKTQEDVNLSKSINNIIKNPYLKAWYTQNLNLENEKLFFLPHGLDYHTIWEKRKKWSNFKLSPTYQEKQLISTLYNSKEFSKRKNLIFNNWHFSLDHGNRRLIFNSMNKDDNFFLNKRLNRFLNWQIQSEYKYIFCPPGKGIDDPRIYESIILGNVPIRIQDSISKMHHDLPIINIQSIEDLTITSIESKYSSFLEKKFNFNILFLNYWKSKFGLIENSFQSNFENISIDDFRKNVIKFYFKNSG